MSDTDNNDTEKFWPDDLEMGDRVDFDGHDYVVVGTGPSEATLDRINGDGTKLEVFRWALTDAVVFELEKTVSQEEFERLVDTDTEQ